MMTEMKGKVTLAQDGVHAASLRPRGGAARLGC
jgi:hypothetical protein